MTSIHPFALAYEVERTLYETSSIWEGIDAQEIPLSVAANHGRTVRQPHARK